MSTDLHDRTRQPSPDEGPDKPEPPKSSLSVAQVVGGALAAMTAAALGSRLSVAGTVVGAAFASIIAAVAGSIYTSSLRRTSKHVSTVLAKVRPTTPGAAPVPAEEAAVPVPVAPPARRSRIGWKPVLVGALLIFAISALALTGIELVTGHALSGGSGTTVGQVADPGTQPSAKPTPRRTALPSATPSATAEPSPASSATPSSEPTPEPSTSSSAAPTPSATAEPSSTPTAEGGPSGAVTPAS